jgi:hypothetical protein
VGEVFIGIYHQMNAAPSYRVIYFSRNLVPISCNPYRSVSRFGKFALIA